MIAQQKAGLIFTIMIESLISAGDWMRLTAKLDFSLQSIVESM